MLGDRLQRLVPELGPLVEMPRRQIVVTLVLRTTNTKVQIEIEDWEGVRATSLLCLLGLGLGLGSLLVYRLASRLFSQSIPRNPRPVKPPSGKTGGDSPTRRTQGTPVQRVSPVCTPPCRRSSPTLTADKHPSPQPSHNHHESSSSVQTTPESELCNRSAKQTPASDSGISTMGNQLTDTSASVTPDSPSTAVYYTSGGGIRFRGIRTDRANSEDGEFEFILLPEKVKYTRMEPEGREALRKSQTPRNSAERSLGRRSPAQLRRQLTIDIPSSREQKPMLSSTSSETLAESFEQEPGHNISSDQISVGGFSLMPNYSPTSLFEKNLRLRSTDSFSPGLEISQELENSSEDVFHSALDNTAADQTNSNLPEQIHQNGAAAQPLDNSAADVQLPNQSGIYTTPSQDPFELRSSREDSPFAGNLPQHSTPFEWRRKESSSRRRTSRVEDIPEDDILHERRSLQHSHSMASFASDISAYTEHSDSSRFFSFHGGHSIDLPECLSGMATPDSELFSAADMGLGTVANMEKIQNELSELEKEISDLNHKVTVLSSKEDLTEIDDAELEKDLDNVLKVLERHRSRDYTTFYKGSASEDGDFSSPASSEPSKLWRRSYHHSGEYMWDYRSDLATSEANNNNNSQTQADQFVARRPMIGRLATVETPDAECGHESPSFENVRAYLRSLDNTSFDFNASGPSRQNSCAVSDIFIDDDLSGLAPLSSRVSFRSKESSPSVDISKSPASMSDFGDVVDGNAVTVSVKLGEPVIGPQQDLQEISQVLANTTGERAALVKQYCEHIKHHTDLKRLCHVRGDAYSMIRAVLYQVLVHRRHACKHLGDRHHVMQWLEALRTGGYLHRWHFNARLMTVVDSIYSTSLTCLNTYFTQVEKVYQLGSHAARVEQVTELLNRRPEVDLQLMEAVKLLMAIDVLHLVSICDEGKELPIGINALLIKGGRPDPSSVIKMVAQVGHGTYMNQGLFPLLSHTLGVNIEVLCLNTSGHTPDTHDTCSEDSYNAATEEPNLPTIHLLTEDYHQYHILES